MPTARTVIDGFTVEIEPNDGREGVNCYVSKGRHGSSLAVVEDFGAIEVDGGSDIVIPTATQARILAFAIQHGY